MTMPKVAVSGALPAPRRGAPKHRHSATPTGLTQGVDVIAVEGVERVA